VRAAEGAGELADGGNPPVAWFGADGRIGCDAAARAAATIAAASAGVSGVGCAGFGCPAESAAARASAASMRANASAPDRGVERGELAGVLRVPLPPASAPPVTRASGMPPTWSIWAAARWSVGNTAGSRCLWATEN